MMVWLQHLKQDWQQINSLQSDALQQVLQKHHDIFKQGLGTLMGYKAKIHTIPDVSPRCAYHAQYHIPCFL